MRAKFELSLPETRVIGCLIEKEVTTPDQYPLSLNALTNACNQKSNREPVLELDETTVQNTIDNLVKKYLVSDRAGFSGRVTKYKHRFCNTEFGDLKFTEQELGIVCVMLLRGPQTPGELRTRTNRICAFSDVHEVEDCLDALINREDGPFVVKLPREPGKREVRYAHLFSGEVKLPEVQASAAPASAARSPGSDRVAVLEREVRELRAEIRDIKAGIATLRSQS